MQIHVGDPIPHRAAPYEELFFLGHLPPLPLWKSAPMQGGMVKIPHTVTGIGKLLGEHSAV